MFDNLNNSNQSGRQSVDDIFAETDNAADMPRNQAPTEITAQRVGLTASSGMVSSSMHTESKSGGKGFKIAIIIMVVVILGLLGFLAYNKFFKVAPIDTTSVPVTRVATTTTATQNINNSPVVADNGVTSSSTFVANIPSVDTTTSEATSPVAATTTTEINTSVATTTTVNNTPVDSDSDGLTDVEEVAAGTNINLIDTDNDGLSDYEEVKIYKTNPLVADTDGDSFSDGQEVRGGYNPNGSGKMPGNVIK
jgi:cytoskeletal protein RodZ